MLRKQVVDMEGKVTSPLKVRSAFVLQCGARAHVSMSLSDMLLSAAPFPQKLDAASEREAKLVEYVQELETANTRSLAEIAQLKTLLMEVRGVFFLDWRREPLSRCAVTGERGRERSGRGAGETHA